jgi:hypothetical protein
MPKPFQLSQRSSHPGALPQAKLNRAFSAGGRGAFEVNGIAKRLLAIDQRAAKTPAPTVRFNLAQGIALGVNEVRRMKTRGQVALKKTCLPATPTRMIFTRPSY